MNNLNKFGLVPVIRELTEKETPFLGILSGSAAPFRIQ